MINKLKHIAVGYESRFTKRHSNSVDITKSVITEGTQLSLDVSQMYKIYGSIFPNYTLEKERIITYLNNENGCFMDDSPAIIMSFLPAILNAKGAKKILLAGLGLGVLNKILLQFYHEIERIDIVENNKDVINIVGENLSIKENVIEADFSEYIKHINVDEYDYCWIDCYLPKDNIYTDFIRPTKMILIEKNLRHDFWREFEFLRLSW